MTYRMARGASLLFIAWLALATVPVPTSAQAGAPESSPRLVVLVAVDQLRRDRADPQLPGGIGKLMREGRVYVDGVLDHAVTETCPGHASMVTGRHPGPSGIPANRFTDRATGEEVYCVADSSAEARTIGDEAGRSPLNLKVDTLGDWLKAKHPAAKVFSVSAKDRSAVTMAGKRPDGAYWFVRKGGVGFTTSRYYRDTLPAWAQAWHGEAWPRQAAVVALPDRWKHEFEPPDPRRPDDYPEESDEFGRTSGHALRDEDRETFARQLYASPFLDELTLLFAQELVEREKLGAGGHPDFLAISLAATDIVGHRYGPESVDAYDALRRTDAALGDFFAYLEARFGEGGVLVVLTSDHGILPLPGWLAETGRSRCPIASGRSGVTMMGVSLLWEIHKSFGHVLSIPKKWLHFSGGSITVDRAVAKEMGVSVEQVAAVVKANLEDHEAIAHVWTHDEIQNRPGAMAELYRHSFDPQKTGDLVIQLEPTCLVSPYDVGTTHGSPYSYDRKVPIVFYGAGVRAGRVEGPAATIDIAPTLASMLRLEVPNDLDGRSLLPRH